jgi:sarcosine oxidase subunit beta
LTLSDGETVEGDVLVNAAGPHSSQINAMAGASLPLHTRALRRETHTVPNPRYADGVTPVPVVGDLDSGVYFRPEGRGHQLVVGSADPKCDALDWVDDPDDFHRGLTEAYHHRHVMRLMKRFPEVGLGTDVPGYYVCIGTSGSSFKTSPVLGQYMALLIEQCEGGRDSDAEPVPFHLHRLDRPLDPRFLSRLRGKIRTTETVIG